MDSKYNPLHLRLPRTGRLRLLLHHTPLLKQKGPLLLKQKGALLSYQKGALTGCLVTMV